MGIDEGFRVLFQKFLGGKAQAAFHAHDVIGRQHKAQPRAALCETGDIPVTGKLEGAIAEGFENGLVLHAIHWVNPPWAGRSLSPAAFFDQKDQILPSQKQIEVIPDRFVLIFQ